MEGRAGRVSESEGLLALVAWETRFAEPSTEALYRLWHADQAVIFNRAALLGGGVGLWTGAMILFGSLGVLLSWVPVILLVILPVSLGAAFTTYRPSLRAWMIPCTMVANTIGGFVMVGLINSTEVPPDATLATVVMVSYFGMAVTRARPTQAAAAVAPYMVLEAVILARNLLAGRASRATFAIELFVLAVAFLTGLALSVLIDIASRRSYRQERIIEAQKETIAHERGKSEALLKSELAHQVAERSREIGEALTRVSTPSASRLPMPGDSFHTRYRVVRALGEGGMGSVFEVERVTDAQRLALKLVTGRVSGSTAARFAREAEIGARVHHPNVVSIVDVGIADGLPFLVMGLAFGGSLEAYRWRFGDVAWGMPLLRQIATGLAVLHEAGVVHRDLKPANVLLDGPDGAPLAKISDFGISRLGDTESASTDPEARTIEAAPDLRAGLTATGALMGTPSYMAPEGARGGRALTPAADVFALGVVAYELLTGVAPFDPAAVLVVLAKQPLPAPSPVPAVGVDAITWQAILACLKEDPSMRPTAREVRAVFGGGDEAAAE